GLSVGFPTVDGVTPQLAGGAEVVRRHTGDDFWPSRLVQFEQVAVGPYVRAIESDIDGNVAHDANVVACAVRLQRAPLLLEFELDKLMAFNLVTQLVARALNGIRLMQRQIGIPESPRNIIVSFLERHEQGKFVEPAGVPFAESGERRALGRRTALKRPESMAQPGDLPCDHGAEIHLAGRKLRARFQVGGIEITVRHQRVEADQYRIAGEG